MADQLGPTQRIPVLGRSGLRGPESCAFRRGRPRTTPPAPLRRESTSFSTRGRRWTPSPPRPPQRRPRPTAPVDGRRGPESCAFRRRRSRGPLPVPVRPEGTAFSPRGRRWPWSPSALVGRLVASRLSPLAVRISVLLLCTQSQDKYSYYFLLTQLYPKNSYTCK